MKIPYTKKQIEHAFSRMDRCKYFGLCAALANNEGIFCSPVPKFLRALGGHSKKEWFWPPIQCCSNIKKENKINEVARNQRLTMLAFMWVWSQDKDFEV